MPGAPEAPGAAGAAGMAERARDPRVSWSGRLAIDAAAGRVGVVRAHVVLPSTWRRRGSLNARTLRFDTGNSCRHRVTLTPRLVQAPDASATDRAAGLAP